MWIYEEDLTNLHKSPFEKIASVNFLNFILQNRGHNSLMLARPQDNFLHSTYPH